MAAHIGGSESFTEWIYFYFPNIVLRVTCGWRQWMGQLRSCGQTSPSASSPSSHPVMSAFLSTHALPASDVCLCLTFTNCTICTGAVSLLIKAFASAEGTTCPDHLGNRQHHIFNHCQKHTIYETSFLFFARNLANHFITKLVFQSSLKW